MNEELIEEIREILEQDVKALNEEGKLTPEYFQRISRKDRLIIALTTEGVRTAHDNKKRIDDIEVRQDKVDGKVRWLLGGIGTIVTMIIGGVISWIAGLLPN